MSHKIHDTHTEQYILNTMAHARGINNLIIISEDSGTPGLMYTYGETAKTDEMQKHGILTEITDSIKALTAKSEFYISSLEKVKSPQREKINLYLDSYTWGLLSARVNPSVVFHIACSSIDFSGKGNDLYDFMSAVAWIAQRSLRGSESVSVLEERLEEAESQYQNLSGRIDADSIFHAIVTRSDLVKNLFLQLKNVISRDVTILLKGESGTGKDLFAKAIHNGSHRSKGPFVVVNSSTITRDLAESILFGHKKGAFTGAQKESIGLFQQADGGTIFLDEIGDMPFDVQAKILRVIEDKEVTPLGASSSVKSDFRVIAATNRDLDEAIAQKEFRSDLYYRLSEFTLAIPPLRQRDGDISFLTDHFISVFADLYEFQNAAITPGALKYFQLYEWPGNIRELKSTVQRLMLTGNGTVITEDDLLNLIPSFKALKGVSGNSINDTNDETLADVEKEAVLKAYYDNNKNVEKAARHLNIGRTTMYRKLKKYNILQ